MFRSVNKSEGKLPEPLPMPITAGNGPSPSGSTTADTIVRVSPFFVMLTRSVSTSNFATIVSGFGGFRPISKCCISAPISARLLLQSLNFVDRPEPSDQAKGSVSGSISSSSSYFKVTASPIFLLEFSAVYTKGIS